MPYLLGALVHPVVGQPGKDAGALADEPGPRVHGHVDLEPHPQPERTLEEVTAVAQ